MPTEVQSAWHVLRQLILVLLKFTIPSPERCRSAMKMTVSPNHRSIRTDDSGRTDCRWQLRDRIGGRRASRSVVVCRGRCRPSVGCSRCRRMRCGSSSVGRFSGGSFWSSRWFVARVSLAPTLLVAIPFTVLVSFTLNILLRELGAADLSRCGCGVRRGDPGGSAGDGVDRGRRGRDGDVRGSGVAHDSRGDRRDGGAGDQPGAASGDAADAGLGFGGVAAQQPGGDHRHSGRLLVLGLRPGRQSGRVRGGHHAVDRGAGGDHLVCEGGVVRVDRGVGGLLPGA